MSRQTLVKRLTNELGAGCGKTELCDRFGEEGFHVLDETFLDMPSYGIHPQSLLMETTWVCSWFEKLLKRAKEVDGKNRKDTVLIADRSPFSAVFYSHHGNLLKPLIEKQIEEVSSYAGVEIFTVYLSVAKGALWNRIQSRLQDEPDRVLYKEDNQDWLDQVHAFYDNFPWDITVDNTEEDETATLNDLMRKTIRVSSSKIPRLERVIRLTRPNLLWPLLDSTEHQSDEEQKVTTLDSALLAMSRTLAGCSTRIRLQCPDDLQ